MNFYIKKHETFSNKLKHSLLILHITDLHISNRFDFCILKNLILEAQSEKPDLICLTGDLLDEASFGDDNFLRLLISDYFTTLSKIAPIYIVKGNHDLLTKDVNNNWHYYNSNRFFELISSLDNVYVLRDCDSTKLFKNTNLYGIDYGIHIEESEVSKESESVFNKYILNDLIRLNKFINPHEFNILLIHSPKYLEKFKKLNYDLILSGHMHNGGLPNFMDKIFHGNRGIISPISNNLFPDNTRGSIKLSNESTLFIGSPITVSAEHSNKSLIKKLYKPGLTYINVNPQ